MELSKHDGIKHHQLYRICCQKKCVQTYFFWGILFSYSHIPTSFISQSVGLNCQNGGVVLWTEGSAAEHSVFTTSKARDKNEICCWWHIVWKHAKPMPLLLAQCPRQRDTGNQLQVSNPWMYCNNPWMQWNCLHSYSWKSVELCYLPGVRLASLHCRAIKHNKPSKPDTVSDSCNRREAVTSVDGRFCRLLQFSWCFGFGDYIIYI